MGYKSAGDEDARVAMGTDPEVVQHRYADSPEDLYGRTDYPTTPDVRIIGPIKVENSPPTQGMAASITLPLLGSVVETILPQDPRRRSATLLATLQGAIIGTDLQSVMNGRGAALPVNVPMPINDNDGWYAVSASNTTACLLSIITETER